MRAALGVVVKSGWASVVLVSGTAADPRVADSRRIDLSDPADPDARQPYHAGFGTARANDDELARLVASVTRYGEHSVRITLRDYQQAGHLLHGAGLIVGSLTDPARIANDHIRIHALEGQLFRRVIEEAAARDGVPCTIWRERDLYAAAVGLLQQPEVELRARVAALGRGITGPWRAEQKAATLAGWMLLAS